MVHLMGLEMCMGLEMRAGPGMKHASLAHGVIGETTVPHLSLWWYAFCVKEDDKNDDKDGRFQSSGPDPPR